MSNREEKVSEVLEEARGRGLRVVFDSGLLIVRAKPGDPDKQSETIRKMGRYIADIRGRAEKRAIADRGKYFIGERILLLENGEGRLTDVSENGELIVRVSREIRRTGQEEAHAAQVSMGANAADLLIIALDDAPVPADEEQISETPRKRLFGFL